MPYRDTSATRWAVARKREQEAAHSSVRLRELALEIAERLPAGPATLITTSAEGAALAGAVAMLRADPTDWRVVHLGRRMKTEGTVVIVEAVRLGDGVREALLETFPNAVTMDATAIEQLAHAA